MITVFEVLGGLALFLFGVRLLSGGMEKIAGNRLKEILDRVTSRPLRGAIFGTVATAILQSSSLLMVTMIGLINANMMTLPQVLGVMMGKEIGTTITAQVVAFEVGNYSFLVIAIGLILYEFSRRRSWRSAGQVILGFGILFLGMDIMSGSLEELAALPVVRDWLVIMGQSYVPGIIAGIIATAVVQSSSAITGLVVAMGISQTISLNGAIAIMLGANIGTTMTGLLASIRLSTSAKRASIAQILVNLIGVLMFLPFLSAFSDLISMTSTDLARQIANAHTIFNVIVSVVLFPFIRPLSKLSEFLVPESTKKGTSALTRYIDDSQQKHPSVAMDEALRELVRAGNLTAEMVDLSGKAALASNKEAADRLLMVENDVINPLCARIESFVFELSDSDVSQPDKRRLLHLRELVTDIERVGDICVSLTQILPDSFSVQSRLEPKAIEMLDEFVKQTYRIYLLALQAVNKGDADIAELVRSKEEQLDHDLWEARSRLQKWNRDGKLSPDSHNIQMEMLKGLERISDRADSIAGFVLRQVQDGRG
jgi:phosphate:Na+ symporter